jgi:hypothetical protein
MLPNGITDEIEMVQNTIEVKLTASLENTTFNLYKDKLRNQISQNKEKISNDLQIISLKYDKICKLFNIYSLAILFISAFVTLFDALKLLIGKLLIDTNDQTINKDSFAFAINVITLILGTTLTILSSVIRFQNYREKMESLRDIQEKLICVKGDNTRNIVILDMSTNADDHLIKLVEENMKDNAHIINSINIISEISNSEIIKFHNYMADFKNSIAEIKSKEKLDEFRIKKNLENGFKNIANIKNDS